MSSQSLNTGVSFSGQKAYVATSNLLMQDKVAVTLSCSEFGFDLNKDLILKGNDPLINQVISELGKFITNQTAPHLSVAIDPTLFLYSVIPVDHSGLDADSLERRVHEEFSFIAGEKLSAYIYEWIPLQRDKVLILWVPGVVINFLQILATRLSKKLSIVDFEPLAIMNLMNEKQIAPGPGKFYLVTSCIDNGFTFMGFSDKEVLFYEHFVSYPQEDLPFFLLQVLNQYGLNLSEMESLFWYGKFSQTVLSSLKSTLNIQPENLFEKMKVLYHRHQESGSFFLESALSAISVSYRTEG
ncbi:MAG: hypothetical protein J0L62_04270 [Bacteroidetes bacterium]|nr:hypothetical protein [Bacteroidota bacterium]